MDPTTPSVTGHFSKPSSAHRRLDPALSVSGWRTWSRRLPADADDLQAWAPFALAVFFAWGGILVAVSCVLPGRTSPGWALAAALVAVVTAVALLALAERLSLAHLSGLLAVGSLLIALVIWSSGRTTSPDALLFVWVGLYGGVFLDRRVLVVHLSFVAALYAVVLIVLSQTTGADGRAAPQHLLLVVGAVAAAGAWSAVLRAVIARLIDRHVHASRTDPLSGLANHGEVHRLGAELMATSGEPLTVAVIDLDGFKQVNDAHGHGFGDEVLRITARRLRHSLRADDTVGRLGGDEFVVLAPQLSEGDAAVMATRIRATLAQDVHHAGQVLSVRASVGVASRERERTFDELLGRADASMYRAKPVSRPAF